MAETLGWKNDAERQIIAEVYKAFATDFDGAGNPTAYQDWFRQAGIVENHPVKLTRTLQINCNYRPFLLMKEIQLLADKHNLALYLLEVDKNGKPKSMEDGTDLNSQYRASDAYKR